MRGEIELALDIPRRKVKIALRRELDLRPLAGEISWHTLKALVAQVLAIEAAAESRAIAADRPQLVTPDAAASVEVPS